MKRTLLFILALILSSNASAYLRTTHIALSAEALRASVLADPVKSKLLDYGLSTELYQVTVQGFKSTDGKNRSIESLMKYGSYFEDDEETLRPLSHFYDPVNDIALNVPGMDLAAALVQLTGKNVVVEKSPDWVTEDGNINIVSQDFSYKDAMNSFHLALTSTTDTERKQHWGKVFQTLGQMIHHMQDMSQPQHVRNDDHCEGVLKCFGRHDPSWYEKYTGQVIFGDYTKHTFPNNLKPSAINYPIPVFPTAREFWTTRATDSIQNRRGIADFTNRNFVSRDTNFYVDGITNDFTTYKYTYPQPHQGTNAESLVNLRADGQAICDRLKSSNPSISFPTDGCTLDFVSSTVNDFNNGVPQVVSTNSRASTYSLFSQKLNDYGLNAEIDWGDGNVTVSRVFSLNEFNHDSSHNYLIPRAVAFSAGLINHFFRGEIELTKDLAVAIPDGWQISSFLNEEMEGVFTLYYDDVNGNRKPVTGAVWDTANYGLNGVLEGFGFMEVPKFTLPSDRKNGQLLLVFKGRIGQEGDRDGLNNNFVTTGYVFHLKKHRYADIQYPISYITELNSDNTRDVEALGYAFFVNNEIVYEFNTNLFFDTSSSTVTLNNYYVFRYLNDGTVSVIELAASIVCNNFEVNTDSTATYLDRGCINPSTGINQVVLPANSELENVPIGYQTRNWEMGTLSRFDVLNQSPGPIRLFGSWQGVNWMGINIPSSSLIMLENGNCVSYELKHIDPLLEYYSTSTGYTPSDYFGEFLGQSLIDTISILVEFSKNTILDTRCY